MTPRRRGSSRSGAGGESSCRHCTPRPTPLTAPSMPPASIPFHKAAGRDDPDRLHDRGIVDLVDVVLVQEQPVQSREPTRHRVGRVSVSQPEIHREADPGERNAGRQRHEHQLRGRVGVAGCGLMVTSDRSRRGFRRGDVVGRAGGNKALVKECFDPVAPAERMRNANESGQNRANRQNDQRKRHRWRRIVHVRRAMCDVRRAHVRRADVRHVRGAHVLVRRSLRRQADASLAVEREEHEPEHVGRGQERGDQSDRRRAGSGYSGHSAV